MESALRLVMIAGGEPDEVQQLLRSIPLSDSRTIVVHGEVPGSIPVRSATKLEPGRLYSVPLDEFVEIRDRSLVPTNSLRGDPLDALLRSAGDAYGARVIGVLLGGRRGMLGLRRIREAGGIAISHDPAHLAHVDLACARDQLAERVQACCEDREPSTSSDGDTLRDILGLVQSRSGIDFTRYKRAMLFRRIARRMQLLQTDSMIEYLARLERDADELSRLHRDILTSASAFFRDTDAFAALERDVLPKLFTGDGPPVRVWVPGCATGEEAYSLAILLLEHATRIGSKQTLRVFATDIDDVSLGEARRGCYSEAIVADVDPVRLLEFFDRHEDGGYCVARTVRNVVLFSHHDVLLDPPFSQIDMVSCRNVLVYYNRETQDRALHQFHFALAAKGYLFLAGADGAASSTLFSTFDDDHRIWKWREAKLQLALDYMRTPSGRASPEDGVEITLEKLGASNAALAATRVALEEMRHELAITEEALLSARRELAAMGEELALRNAELEQAYAKKPK